ncbi:MAG: DinB family protein, partial [Patescibacteria group bacterium]
MKVALVHDHLAQDGGAERVVRVFQRMFPGAPLFTLVYRPDRAHPDFRGTDIRTSFLQRWPLATRLYQWYLPLMPTAVERFDLRGYDLVLSSCASFAKGVITDPATLHACYLHSPTRYLWNDTVSYVNELRYARLLRSIAPLYLNRIRMWDRLAADRGDREAMFAASKGGPLVDLHDTFDRCRTESLNRLAALGLTDADLSRHGRHPEFGVVTLEQHLATWVAHDLGHISQVVRVMAR